jgi:hypothetical protein
VWASIGFAIGFMAAGAGWLVGELPFPIPTRVPFGVLLLLVIPYSLFVESAGYAIDDAGRFPPTRLGLVGIGCGAATFALEMAALWAVAPWEWAFVVVWLAFPLAVAVGLAQVALRLTRGRGDPADRTSAK